MFSLVNIIVHERSSIEKLSLYGEAGGQEADSGIIIIASEDNGSIISKFDFTDVQIYRGYVLHSGTVVEGSMDIDSNEKCQVDYEHRNYIAPNHSMTHVLNAALRQI